MVTGDSTLHSKTTEVKRDLLCLYILHKTTQIYVYKCTCPFYLFILHQNFVSCLLILA